MKAFFVFAIFVCVTFSGFSQSEKNDRFHALSDSIEYTVSNSNNKLANYDEMIADDGNGKSYSNYRQKYQHLSNALKQSEARLDLYIRTNDKSSKIRDERNNYERLIGEMEKLQSDYDSWLSSR